MEQIAESGKMNEQMQAQMAERARGGVREGGKGAFNTGAKGVLKDYKDAKQVCQRA